MRLMDKITIVVAVYNAEKYLNKCIDSLLNQTYQNTEIILVNDCSKDGSLDICSQYEQKYNNIIVINNPKNMGVSFTRNNGIDASTGDYICFVDSDDYVEANYLQELLNALLSNNSVLSICGCNYHNMIDNTNNSFLWKSENSIEIVSIAKGFELYKSLYLNALWNKLFITKLIKDKNIRFDNNLSIGEDLKFTLDYIRFNNITEAVIISKPLYHYCRWNNSSLMSSYIKQIKGNYLENINLLYEIVKPLNENADNLYFEAVNSLKKSMKYSVLRSKLTKKEKQEYVALLFPDYSKKEKILDTWLIIKEKVAKILHR